MRDYQLDKTGWGSSLIYFWWQKKTIIQAGSIVFFVLFFVVNLRNSFRNDEKQFQAPMHRCGILLSNKQNMLPLSKCIFNDLVQFLVSARVKVRMNSTPSIHYPPAPRINIKPKHCGMFILMQINISGVVHSDYCCTSTFQCPVKHSF